MKRSAMLAPVFAGGALGALVRVGLSEGFGPPDGSWPWATFLANLVGTLVLGYTFEALHQGDARAERVQLLLGTGFCGALTTFSTLQIELLDMLADSRAALAMAYGALSIGLGLLAALAGSRLARHGRPPAGPFPPEAHGLEVDEL